MKLLVLGVLFAVAAQSSARTWRQLQRGHFIADGTNDVAVNILQSLNDKRQNAVFSPLGYTTILAILTEGARGNTRNQLVSALKLPEDTYAVRSTFKRVLSELTTEKEVLNKPQYKNWFYVYKNFTVQESYKNILKDNYLIDVKEIDRYDFPDEEEQSKPIGETTEQPAGLNKQPSEAAENNSSEEDRSKESSEDKNSKENESKENSKEDDSSEEKPKISKKPTNVMKIKEKDDSSKNDKPIAVISDSNEKPEIATEKQQEPAETPSAPSGDIKKESEPSSGLSEGIETTARPEVVSTPEGQEANSDLKTAGSEGSLDVDIRTRDRRDTATALSANKLSTLRESSLKKISRIMAFNALYFRGNWSQRFNLSKEKQVFHVTPNDEKKVDMLHAEDDFEVGKVEDLDAWALDLPYKGDRYSLLILVPAGQDGLDGLLKRLPGFSFYNIDKQLTKLRTRVCLPKLKFYSITKPKDSFIKSGITDLFSEDADLSGISETKGLFLEELVQLVTFELDETDASYNYLTTSDVSDLRATPIPFTADQPFIFFLRDKVENINIVAGIVNDPDVPQIL